MTGIHIRQIYAASFTMNGDSCADRAIQLA
jgi:hypothetical protein